jgi:hypothetical protein
MAIITFFATFLILVNGGINGAIYISLGIVWNLLDWWLYWRPMMKDGSPTVVAYIQKEYGHDALRAAQLAPAYIKFEIMRQGTFKVWWLPIWIVSIGLHSRILQAIFARSSASEFRKEALARNLYAMDMDPRLPAFLRRVAARGHV